MDGIMDAVALREHYGAINPLAEKKVLTHLDAHCRRFIELSPFLVLATSDAAGNVDASPRGDPPGFVAVLDDTTLLVPDRPGNRRVDSFGNIVSKPGVGLLFFVPGIAETLRINGTAKIVTDAELLTTVPGRGKVPAAGLVVQVNEAFFHCGKALIRSSLWEAESRVERATFPTLGRIIADQTRDVGADEADQRIDEAYRVTLY